MKKLPKTLIPSTTNPDKTIRNVRFYNINQIELIKLAASSRGMSFNAFVVLICEGAARRALQMPPEPALGEILLAVKLPD